MASRCRNADTPCSPAQPVCSCFCICCFVLLFVFGLVCFTVGMGSYFAPPTEHSVDSLPLDTRIFSVERESCGDFSLSTDSELVKVMLYLLYDRPTNTHLAASYSLLISYDLFTNADVLTEYKLYLVEGSYFDLTVSVDPFPNGGPGDLQLFIYLYNAGSANPESKGMCYNVSRDSPCARRLTASYEGPHYLSFSFQSSSLSYVRGQITGVLNRYSYEMPGENIRSSCEAPCSRKIDYRDTDTIVVTTSNVTDPEDREEFVHYIWLCTDIRPVGVWVSFVMLVGMFLVMLSIGFIVALCVVLCIRNRTDPEDTEPLIQPYIHGSPVQSGTAPPPQYTAVSENSLRAPPPYTESSESLPDGDK